MNRIPHVIKSLLVHGGVFGVPMAEVRKRNLVMIGLRTAIRLKQNVLVFARYETAGTELVVLVVGKV